jgi:hypothetical protein
MAVPEPVPAVANGELASTRSALRDPALWIVWIAAVLSLALQAARLHPLDADEATNNLAAFEVLRGQWPIWLGGQAHLGAAKAYLDAPLVALLGPSDWVVRLWALLFRCAGVALTMIALRRVGGRRAAVIGGLAAGLWPPQMNFWLLGGFNMGMTAFLWTLGLILVLCSYRFSNRVISAGIGLGLVVGLALWNTPQSLVVIPPLVLAYLTCTHGLAPLSARVLAVGAAGVVGSLPFWVYSVRAGFLEDLNTHVGALPAGITPLGRVMLAGDNLAFYVRTVLWNAVSIEHLASEGQSPWLTASSALVWVVLLLTLLVACAVILGLLFDRHRTDTHRRDAAFWLCGVAGIVVFSLAGIGFTGPGGIRFGGLTRYTMSLFVVLPWLLAAPFVWAGRRWQQVAVTAAVVLALPALADALYGGGTHRSAGTTPNADDPYLTPADAYGERERQRALIERLGVTYLMGDFWDVHTHAFWSRGRVRGVWLAPGWRSVLGHAGPPEPGSGLLVLRAGSALENYLKHEIDLTLLQELPGPPHQRVLLLPADAQPPNPAALFSSIAAYLRDLDRFQRGLDDAVRITAGLVSETSHRGWGPDSSLFLEASLTSGHIAFGPYLALPRGQYEVEFDIDQSMERGPEVVVDVASEAGNRVLWGTQRALSAGGPIRGVFTADGGPSTLFETRVAVLNAVAPVRISDVWLRRSP